MRLEGRGQYGRGETAPEFKTGSPGRDGLYGRRPIRYTVQVGGRPCGVRRGAACGRDAMN